MKLHFKGIITKIKHLYAYKTNPFYFNETKCSLNVSIFEW